MTIEIAGNDSRYLRERRRPGPPWSRKSTRVVDLFSGCGGLTLGVELALRELKRGLEVKLAVESDRFAAATYGVNFQPEHGMAPSRVEDWFDGHIGRALSVCERRTRRLVGPVDLLIGGPPCQGHSTLNNYTRGEDPKNELYLSMVRAAEVLEPEVVLIENVPPLKRDRSRVLERAVAHFEWVGYIVDEHVVSLADIGVPQLRKRHVLLAHRTKHPQILRAIDAARVDPVRTVGWALHDLLDEESKGWMNTCATMGPENLRRAQYLLKTDTYDLPNNRRPRCQRGPHKYKSMYGRMWWDKPAQTITTGFGSPGQGRYIHPLRPRTLTPREAARLQFFPDWFDFSPLMDVRRGLARCIGNAVPPKLSFVLAMHALGSSRMRTKTRAKQESRCDGAWALFGTMRKGYEFPTARMYFK